MKTSVTVFSSLLAFAGISHAQTTFTDDFNRANVAPTTNGTNIGPNWVIGDTSSGTNTPEWELINDQIRVNDTVANVVGNSVMWNTTVSLLEGDFTVSSTMTSITNPRQGGIAFFVQDADSFLTFDIQENSNGWKVRQFDDGTETLVTSGSSSGTIDLSTSDYTLTVASTAADNFDLTIVEEATSTTVVSTSFTDSSLAFNSGFAGLYHDNPTGQWTWDDISVSSPIPEPSAFALLLGASGVLVALGRRVRR